jgi:Ca2+-binding EF-hand superfamily protein
MIFRVFCLLLTILIAGSGSLFAQRGGRGGRDDDDGNRRGRFERRGGFRGGTSGRSRGGFDPSSFLDRLDRNGNGTLDPDEQEGPARMMIARLRREDSSIQPGQPIALSKVKEAFEKMRGGRGRGSDDDDDDDEGDGLTAGTLVPGFGGLELPPLVPGFGAAADLLQVSVTDEDRQRASQTMSRYDRNRNGFIDASEISRRWSGNPLDFDQNRDNRLSPNELAVRYARRRVDEEDRRSERRNDRDRRRDEVDLDELEVEDRFDGRTSYRRRDEPSDELPDWFTDKDQDGDGQVKMSEYASDWTTELVEEFYGYDRNFDGVVTSSEAATGGGGGGTAAYVRQDRNASSRSEIKREVSADEINPRYLKYAKRILSRNDTDEDGSLSEKEWSEMILDVSPADKDKDGKITVEEYAIYLQSRASG